MSTLTRTQKRERKLAAFQRLADGETISATAKAVNINKGTISRWYRSKEYAVWLANRDKGAAADVLPKFYGVGGPDDDPELRARFERALRLTGRLDIAAAYSGAPAETVARWLAIGDRETLQAHTEPFLQAVQVIRNIMLGRDGAGNFADVKVSEQLKAAQMYIDLMDWRQELPHLKIDIEAGRAAILVDGDNAGETPFAIMLDSIRERLPDVLDVEAAVE